MVKTSALGVRRLASEGCRPRLPWAMSLPKLKENPAPIIPIMENLKNDPSRFVRLSVANNLNDISKDNPQIVIALAKNGKGNQRILIGLSSMDAEHCLSRGITRY